MKNKKLIGIITIIVAVLLFACCFILKFKKSADISWGFAYTVIPNDVAELDDLASIVKDAGGKDAYAVKQLNSSTFEGEEYIIYFNAADINAANEVFEKAEEAMSESYILKGEAGTLDALSTTFDLNDVIAYWPMLVVFALAVVYTLIRFGFAYGLTSLVAPLTTVFALCGIISVASLKLNGFTVAAIIAIGILQFITVLFAANVKQSVVKKVDNAKDAFTYSFAKLQSASLITTIIAAVAVVVMLIFGTALIRMLAIEILIGLAISLFVSVYAVLAFCELFGNEK